MALALNFARRPFRDNRPIVVTIGAALLFGALLLALNVRDYYVFRASSAGTLAEIARLNEEASRTEELAARERGGVAAVKLKDLQTQSTILNALLRERDFSWSLLLTRLEHALPDDVYLTRISPGVQVSGDATLSLDFIGKGQDSIVRTLSSLARDPYFEEPVPSSETDPEKGAPEGFQFHLTVQYRPTREPSS
jgi:Tfp pilus assembly protein PilN